MPKISIFDFSFDAPDKKHAGDILDEFDARVFNFMWRKNVVKTLKRYLEQHPAATSEDLEAQLKNIPLSFSVSDIEIESEAINLAYNLIVNQLKNEGLPTPPQIFVHAKELASSSKQVQEQARRNVIARYTVVNTLLSKFKEV